MKKFLFIAAISLLPAHHVAAEEEVKLRIHHFMSAKSTLHEKFLVPFSERLTEASNGRLKAEIFHSMSLGGRPGDLYDQAADGAVDIVLTLPGYTAGRFNHTEVFELPFIVEDTVTGSKAFWDLIESDLQKDEYRDVKVLCVWLHSPGVLHSKQPVRKLEDIRDMEIRGPTRVITDYLGEIGASPVGMPLPQIPESLSKGVIDGTLLPWEITPAIRLSELVNNHTEFGGKRTLYTATLILVMNLDAYEAMAPELRAILDAETGKHLSQQAAQLVADADEVGRAQAADSTIIRLNTAETARWEKAAQPVYDRWVTRASEKGFDGQAAIEQAKALIAAN